MWSCLLLLRLINQTLNTLFWRNSPSRFPLKWDESYQGSFTNQLTWFRHFQGIFKALNHNQTGHISSSETSSHLTHLKYRRLNKGPVLYPLFINVSQYNYPWYATYLTNNSMWVQQSRIDKSKNLHKCIKGCPKIRQIWHMLYTYIKG